MESCESVDREVKNVLEKLNKFHQRDVDKELASVVKAVQASKDEIENVGEDGINAAQTLMLVKTLQAVKESVAKVSGSHRDLHSSVSKVGKTIDKHFVPDYDATSMEEVFGGPKKQRMLNEVILQHLYRQGQLEIGDCLAEETGLSDLKLSKEPFQELNQILEALSNRELGPALDWAARHRHELDDRGTSVITQSGSIRSSLEMKLHKLQFIKLLRSGDTPTAIAYARQHFPPFVGHHEKEIQGLMGGLMFSGARLETSPYKHLLDASLWHEIGDLFIKDACLLMGLSVESPLAVAINAGCTALPALLNIKQVMHSRQVAGVIHAEEELPIEIDLGPDCRFHSIFACPILRQQTTDLNPPMRLTCGHCISRDALNKLSSGHKLKCPYCPVEQSPNDARQITF